MGYWVGGGRTTPIPLDYGLGKLLMDERVKHYGQRAERSFGQLVSACHSSSHHVILWYIMYAQEVQVTYDMEWIKTSWTDKQYSLL